MPTRLLLAVSLALFGLLSIGPASAAGSMYLNRSIVVFQPGQPPRDDVLVINAEKEVLYVSLDVFEILRPGTEEEERVQEPEPQKAGLIATPNKLIVPPVGRKPVRIVNLRQDDEEHIYRINVTPILPPLEDTKTSIVRVIVAYQLLVIVQPKVPVEDLRVTRENGALQFHNMGNTNVLLGEGTQCDPQGNACLDLPTKRVYAGNTFSVVLPYTTPVNYKLTSIDATRQETF